MSDLPIVLRQTQEYLNWFGKLRDREAKLRIAKRLIRIRRGNFGDVKPVGGGVSELRVDYGPGYRIYFIRRERMVVILLVGGDKRTQRDDIRVAQDLATRWDDHHAS